MSARIITATEEIKKEKERLKNARFLDAKSARKETICNILMEEERFKIIDNMPVNNKLDYVRLQVINPVGKREVSVELYQDDSVTIIGIKGNALHPDGHKIIYDGPDHVILQLINPVGKRKINVGLYRCDSVTTMGKGALYTERHTYKTNYQRTLKRHFQNLALEYIAGKAKLKNLSKSGLQDPNIPFFGYRIANKNDLDQTLVTRVYDVALEYHEKINSPRYGGILKNNMEAIDRRQKISVVELFL